MPGTTFHHASRGFSGRRHSRHAVRKNVGVHRRALALRPPCPLDRPLRGQAPVPAAPTRRADPGWRRVTWTDIFQTPRRQPASAPASRNPSPPPLRCRVSPHVSMALGSEGVHPSPSRRVSPRLVALASPALSPAQSRGASPTPGDHSETEDDAKFSQEEDELPVYLLSHFAELADEVPDGSYVAVDIDETLIMTRNSPCKLLTPKGVRQFQKYGGHRFSDFKSKNELCNRLQKALKDKVEVEESTPMVLRSLQDRGCCVFAVTARYAEMASVTECSLARLGINMARSSPVNPGPFVDKATKAYYLNGILYCNNENKGVVLNTFLRSLFQEALAMRAAGEVPQGLPQDIFFVDDTYDHAVSVVEELKVAEELGISVNSYHYAPPALAQDPNDESEDDNVILQFQMDAFVDTGAVLSDSHASSVLEEMRRSTPIASPPCATASPFAGPLVPPLSPFLRPGGLAPIVSPVGAFRCNPPPPPFHL